ncbi:MAG: hypothetical protein LUQ69_09480 [Methanoregulaceae archaeon]|nr:hypothetical protein [Methanoregulaceae archaeon]
MFATMRLLAGTARFLWVLLLIAASVQAGEMALTVDDIVSPAFQAKAIRAKLSGPELSRFEASIGELSFRGKIWRNVRLDCPQVQMESSTLQCPRGTLQAGEPVAVSFLYGTAPSHLDLILKFARGERWHLTAKQDRSGWDVAAQVDHARADRLAVFLPDGFPRPTAGAMSGTARLAGKGGEAARLVADVTINGLAFSDEAGLHAGEKVDGRVRLTAARQAGDWQWRGDLDWQRGEIFWQPLYFAQGGNRFSGEGHFGQDAIQIAQGHLQLAGIGAAEVSGRWDRAGRRLAEFGIRGSGLDLSGLYQVLLKPFLEKTSFAKLETHGRVNLDWQARGGETTRFDLTLQDASVEDAEQRFALRGVNAEIPWASGEERQADIRVQGGSMWRLPLGAFRIPVTMRGWNFSIPAVAVPVVDGTLNIADFQAKREGADWQWQFSGGLTPVSMEQLSDALKLPVMHGTLSGMIPHVSYARTAGSGSALRMDGALLVRAFDGTAVVKNLSLLDPFGRAPRLLADVDMRNLDMDLLTRTFSFGKMQGRIDVMVDHLELANWQPVKFDAEIRSSPGDYPKKISQRAVENITALGGGGASAALRRSFLRFFEEFGYSRIGLSCRLRNNICLMDGVEPAPQGYVIVKGGGIPAINVIGYNHNVNWDELLVRLKRITQSNVKPIVQ